MWIEKLKQLDTNRISLEEGLELRACARHLSNEYDLAAIPVPEWLSEVTSVLAKDIAGRTRDAIEKRLAELKAQELGLESAAEKRERIKREREALEAKLGSVQQPA